MDDINFTELSLEMVLGYDGILEEIDTTFTVEEFDDRQVAVE